MIAKRVIGLLLLLSVVCVSTGVDGCICVVDVPKPRESSDVRTWTLTIADETASVDALLVMLDDDTVTIRRRTPEHFSVAFRNTTLSLPVDKLSDGDRMYLADVNAERLKVVREILTIRKGYLDKHTRAKNQKGVEYEDKFIARLEAELAELETGNIPTNESAFDQRLIGKWRNVRSLESRISRVVREPDVFEILPSGSPIIDNSHYGCQVRTFTVGHESFGLVSNRIVGDFLNAPGSSSFSLFVYRFEEKGQRLRVCFIFAGIEKTENCVRHFLDEPEKFPGSSVSISLPDLRRQLLKKWEATSLKDDWPLWWTFERVWSNPCLRAWRDASGNLVADAEFAGYSMKPSFYINGPEDPPLRRYVELKKHYGSTYPFPVERLSKEDQKWLRDAAIAAIEKLGGSFKVGEHFASVDFRGTQVDDAGLEHLKGLTGLSRLHLSGTHVSDAGLKHLKGLTSLQTLWLDNTQVTDAGLVHLKGITGFLGLDLSGTQITDAGLEHVKGFTSLQSLYVSKTQVTDTGLEHLKDLTTLRFLRFSNTQVTDASLKHLEGLTRLQRLDLDQTQVTDAGVNELKKELPDCQIVH